MTSNRCEILIQRCVDNECSIEERQELLHLLNTEEDGWKNLACTYMEEQLFESACVDQLAAAGTEPVVPAGASPRSRHWFHHPATSMVLSACVASLLVVVGLKAFQQPQRPVKTVDTEPPVAEGDRELAAAMPVSTHSDTAWLEADGMDPRELPVYSNVAEFIPSLEAFRQQSHQSVRNIGLSGVGTRVRYLKLKIGSDYVLFPVEETAIEQQMQ